MPGKILFFPGHTLQKKWRNIRDNFVRELKKMATRKTGMSMIRRKNRYMFFTDLLFLKDAILSNQQVDLNDVFSDLETCTKPGTVDTDTSIPFVEPIVTPDEITCDAEMENNLQQEKPPRQDPLWQEPPKQEPTRQVRVNLPAPPSILKPPPIKKWKPEEGIDGKLLEVLNKNMKKMESENDEDRLFFLSLVKDFKMVPQHLQLQTKCKIIQVIAKARQTDNHSRNSFHSSPVSFQSEESTSSRDSSEFVTPTIKSESVLEFNNHH